jgi:hypothetical protein
LIRPGPLQADRGFLFRARFAFGDERNMGAVKAGAAALAAVLLAGSARAADLRILDVKAYAFLEHAGKLSDDLVGSGQSLVDAPRGGAPGGDTATGLLIDFTFGGDKNASPKYATATVELTQTGRGGQQVITHKAFTNFIFGPDGIEHKAMFLEAATCMPLAIQVHAGKTEKSAKLDFRCKEERAP